MCTGKRQTHIRNAPSSRTAVTGIGPYEPSAHEGSPWAQGADSPYQGGNQKG